FAFPSSTRTITDEHQRPLVAFHKGEHLVEETPSAVGGRSASAHRTHPPRGQVSAGARPRQTAIQDRTDARPPRPAQGLLSPPRRATPRPGLFARRRDGA